MAEVQEIQNGESKKTYDTYIKEFMGYCSHKNIVQFINRLYGTDFPLDSEVERLNTETHNKGEERRSDFMIRINERVFHMEVESNDGDGEMVFRMFEYGVLSAYSRREKNATGILTMKFPTPLIIYLRSSDKTPAEFTINLDFGDGEKLSRKVPVKKLADYTPETLIDGKLYALALFYPMKYEALLCKKHTNEDEIKFLNEATAIIDKVFAANETGEISTVERKLILSGFEDIFQRVISKAEILEREEVNGFMENVRAKYAFKELNWMAEAGEKKSLEIAQDMKRDNLPLDMIQKYTKLPLERIQAL